MKRRGVIAALAVIVSALKGQTVNSPKSLYVLDLSPAPPPASEVPGVLAFSVFSHPEGIRVIVGDRVVTLTGEQIMDALEGKA